MKIINIRKLLVFVFFMYVGNSLFAVQDSLFIKSKQPIGYTLKGHFGNIFKHTEVYSNIGKTNNTHVAEFGILIPKTGTHNWHHAFNYPEVMFSLIYADLGNPLLGKAIAGLANISIDAIKTDAYSIYLRIGAGAAYLTQYYDSIKNPNNEIIGSPLNEITKVGLGANIFFHPKWRLNGGLSITHFSNGGVKKPNRGINLRSIELGLSYTPSFEKTFTPLYTCNKKRKVGFLFKAGWGLTNQNEYINDVFEVWTGALIASVFTGKYNAVQLGISTEYNWYNHRLIHDNRTEFKERKIEQIGIVLGDELLFGKTGVSYQLIRVVNQGFMNDRWRTRMGLNYYFADIDKKRCSRAFAGIGLIAHKFTAHYAEVCAGFVF
jgi:hypothetical protein